jgi:hypothetical protein
LIEPEFDKANLKPERTNLMHITMAHHPHAQPGFLFAYKGPPIGSKKLDEFLECISIFFEHTVFDWLHVHCGSLCVCQGISEWIGKIFFVDYEEIDWLQG